MRKSTRGSGLILFIVAAVLLIMEIYVVVKNTGIERNWVSSKAIITGVKEEVSWARGRRHRRRKVKYRCSVIYEVEGGERLRGEISYTTRKREGDMVNLYYNPDKPSELADVSSERPLMVLYPIFAGVCVVVGVILIRRDKRY